MAAATGNLQQIDVFLDRDSATFDEAAQGTPFKLLMIGNGKMAAIGAVVDHMAAFSMMGEKTDLLKRLGRFPNRR